MLQKRLLAAAVMLPIALAAIYLGGIFYSGLITALLLVAAWEYHRLFHRIDRHPSLPLALLGVLLLSGSRSWSGFQHTPPLLTALILLSSAYHMISYERKPNRQAADLGATLSIIFYIGWLGSYLISLRELPGGMWWTFLILPTVWIADTAAYLIGSAVGSRPLSPNTSPNKTWEGYLGSATAGLLGGFALAYLYSKVLQVPALLTPAVGGALGLIISLTIPVGDLVESMIKRQASVKDSGDLFPGHGGVFDRLDSLFWAAPLGFYLIHYLIH